MNICVVHGILNELQFLIKKTKFASLEKMKQRNGVLTRFIWKKRGKNSRLAVTVSEKNALLENTDFLKIPWHS